jgi:hypothetical protein
MMNKMLFAALSGILLILLILVSGVDAEASVQEQGQVHIIKKIEKPTGVLSIATITSESISYQGILEENNTPVTGDRDMDFSLYSNDTCTNFVDGIFGINDVPIDNGIFSVKV